MIGRGHDELSRLISHALRHEPWVYELELDDEGWVSVTQLLNVIRDQGPRWANADVAELFDMINSSPKQRHEIRGDRIRALYGHSVPGRLVKMEAEPPTHLFHGTSPRAWARIQHEGLHPMLRQYVHLSVDAAMAEEVGGRKATAPVILVINAADALEHGSRFWRGNDVVWLADAVAPDYIAARPGRSVD